MVGMMSRLASCLNSAGAIQVPICVTASTKYQGTPYGAQSIRIAHSLGIICEADEKKHVSTE